MFGRPLEAFTKSLQQEGGLDIGLDMGLDMVWTWFRHGLDMQKKGSRPHVSRVLELGTPRATLSTRATPEEQRQQERSRRKTSV